MNSYNLYPARAAREQAIRLVLLPLYKPAVSFRPHRAPGNDFFADFQAVLTPDLSGINGILFTLLYRITSARTTPMIAPIIVPTDGVLQVIIPFQIIDPVRVGFAALLDLHKPFGHFRRFHNVHHLKNEARRENPRSAPILALSYTFISSASRMSRTSACNYTPFTISVAYTTAISSASSPQNILALVVFGGASCACFAEYHAPAPALLFSH